MSSSPAFVVVGGGLSGAKAVEALREQGFDGSLVFVSEELHLPYERPPLSKDYLAGFTTSETFTVHPDNWYREHQIELRMGVRATAIHRDQREVELAGGARIGYDKLLLATGSRSRRLSVPGARARGVHQLRSLDDSDSLHAALATSQALVVIGGGWIGLEVAAVARQRGMAVTVVEMAELPVLAALGPEMATVFAELHREHGVEMRFDARVEQITTEQDAVTGVRLADGATIPADTVLVAIGAEPNVELAQLAGLAVDNGVLVDSALHSSDPDILAVGDIAAHQHPFLGTRVRVEHWATALNQPTAVAATMLGRPTPYTELPYFFTDQYDLGMEYIGYAPIGDYHRVITRGDVAAREFVALWLDARDHVLAGMNVNIWDVNEDIKALITARQPMNPKRLANPDIPLDQLLSTT